MADLTDTQIIIMDTLRSTVSHIMLLSIPHEDPVRVATCSTLAEQGLSWDQFVEYVRK